MSVEQNIQQFSEFFLKRISTVLFVSKGYISLKEYKINSLNNVSLTYQFDLPYLSRFERTYEHEYWTVDNFIKLNRWFSPSGIDDIEYYDLIKESSPIAFWMYRDVLNGILLGYNQTDLRVFLMYTEDDSLLRLMGSVVSYINFSPVFPDPEPIKFKLQTHKETQKLIRSINHMLSDVHIECNYDKELDSFILEYL